MKKRILSLILAVLMVLSVTVVASAESDTVEVVTDLTIAGTSGNVYSKAAQSWASTIGAATFKMQCNVDLQPVRDAFAKYEATALRTEDEVVIRKFNEMKTTGTFTVTIEYTDATIPAAVELPAETAQYYTITARDDSAAGKLVVTVATAHELTIDELKNGALNDITLSVGGISVSDFDVPATIKASMTGTSHTERGGDTKLDVTYNSAESAVTATAKKSSSGTGVSDAKRRYTLTFDVDGDTTLVSSVRKEEGTELKTADFKILHKDGYTFKGWFLDKAMTEKVGETITLTKNMTVYGGFEKVGGASEEISGKLETVDHFAYVSGYPDGTVRPEANITREETAMMFYRLLTEAYRANVASKTNNFDDVAAERWSNDAISTLVNAGILSGYPDGNFNPDAAITRAEFATLVTRFVGIDETATHSFTDLSGHWAEKYVATAVKLGWIAGYDDGTFRPDGKITRAEAMTLVNRILYRYVNGAGQHNDAVKWPDNTEAKWYYFAVQEATNTHDYNRQDDGVYENWTGLRK